MTRKKDSFWEYAEHLNGRFKCNFCERDFAGGAPRIKSHLSGIKGRDIEICTKVPNDVQMAAAATIKGVHKRLKTEAFSSNSDEISSEVCEKNDSSVLDNLLGKFLLLNNVDCGVVKSPSFIDFVNAVAAFGPDYNLPSCSTLETAVIPGLLQEVEAHVSNVKESWGETGCTLISDVWWDDNENRSFINIIAHSPKGIVMLHSVEVPKDKSISDFLEVMISFSIQTVRANNVVQYINGAQSLAPTGCLLANDYPHICMTPCAASEIQSLFEEVHTELEWFRAAFDNATCLVNRIYGHNILLSLMRKHTNNRELGQPQSRELSSNYDMLMSIIEVRRELLQLVQSPEWLSPNDGTQELGKDIAKIIRSSEFWNQVQEIVLALEPLCAVLNLVDRYGSSSGYLYEAMEIATQKIRRIYDDNPTKYKRLWEIFNSRKHKIVHPIHTAAACLNPAYMYTHMCRNKAKVYEVMDFLVENFVAHADKKPFVKELMEYHNREPKFFSDTEKIMLETYHPCKWWDYCGQKLPVLRKYALRILSQPCSSLACKQGLSAFRSAQMKQQQRFAVESPSNNLPLRMNMILTANLNARGVSDKPIDLTELSRLNFIDKSFFHELSNGEVAHPSDLQPSHRSGFGFSSKQYSSQKSFQLQFVTRILSPQVTGQEIKGEHGSPIYVFLIDPVTGDIVQGDGVSTLNLTASALQGDFDEDARNDWTNEDFRKSEISDIPIMTGNLQVTLRNGMGTLGDFQFNYASSITRSGKFRLGVKTSTGDSEGVRIREGISNAFVVEPVEVTRRHDAAAHQTRLPEDSQPTNNMYQLGQLWSPSQIIVDGEAVLYDQFFDGMWDAEVTYKHKQKDKIKLRQAAIRWLKLKAILKWAILRRIVVRNRAQRVVAWNQTQKRLYSWSKGGERIAEEHVLKGHAKMYFQEESKPGIHAEKEEMLKPLQKEEQELFKLADSSSGDPPKFPRPDILQQDHSLTLFPSLLTGHDAEQHTEDEMSEKGDDKMVHEQSDPLKSTNLNAGESAPPNVDRPGNPFTLFPSLLTEPGGDETVDDVVMVDADEGLRYDVFLSFRGMDCRESFVDCLYSRLDDEGVRTFKDDLELPVGGEIGPELMRAIKQSKMSIVIFSKDYASSNWCLKEVAEMVKRMDESKHMIMPIFLDVTPNEVQHQTGSYKKAFSQHEKNYGSETVKEWRDALQKVVKLKGLELKKEANGNQGEFIKLVLARVLNSLKKVTAKQHSAPSSEMDWEMISWSPSRKLDKAAQGNEDQLCNAPSKAAIRWPKFRSSSRWLSMFTSSASKRVDHNTGSQSGEDGEKARVDQSSVISGGEPSRYMLEDTDLLSTQGGPELSQSGDNGEKVRLDLNSGISEGEPEFYGGIRKLAQSIIILPNFGTLYLPEYTLRDLEIATENFSQRNVIGVGGYGIVYRGNLTNGMPVAVKKLCNYSGLSEDEFRIRVEGLSHVWHKNLVQLLGYCTEGTTRSLVYEYMPNGNLERWLHGPLHQLRPLTWAVRMKIASDVANALAFLHEEMEPRVLHRDFKASNILIDQDFNAKLSNFGNARLMDAGKSHDMTRSLGTSSFLDPEGANSGLLNEKSDIYSFGMVLLKTIRGRDPLAYDRLAHGVNLAEWLDGMVRSGRSELLLDPNIETRPSAGALEWALLIALRCLDPDANKRPKMSEVVRMLETRRDK